MCCIFAPIRHRCTMYNLPSKEQTAKRLQILDGITRTAQAKSIKKDIEWYERTAKANAECAPSWSAHCTEWAEKLKAQLQNL